MLPKNANVDGGFSRVSVNENPFPLGVMLLVVAVEEKMEGILSLEKKNGENLRRILELKERKMELKEMISTVKGGISGVLREVERVLDE